MERGLHRGKEQKLTPYTAGTAKDSQETSIVNHLRAAWEVSNSMLNLPMTTCITKLMVTFLNKLTRVLQFWSGRAQVHSDTTDSQQQLLQAWKQERVMSAPMRSMTDLQEEGTLVLRLRTGGPEPLREVLGFGSRHKVSQSQRLLLQLFGGFPGQETFTLALQDREKAAQSVLTIQPTSGTVTSFANYCPVTNEPSFSQSGILVKVGFSRLMFQKHCRFPNSWESSSLHP